MIHPPGRAALHEAITENKTSCSKMKGAGDLQKMVNEMMAGQKLLMENLQKQQNHLAKHIKDQQRALEKDPQTISQLTSNGDSLDALPMGQGHASERTVLGVAMNEMKRRVI